MNHKHFFIVTLAVIIGFAAMFWFFRWNTTDARKKAPPPLIKQSVVINMSDKAFLPAQLKVKKGTAVTFLNKGKELRWPASNIHPTHQIYPEFDPKGPVSPGASWSFTFNKVGKWRFHDHLVSGVVGVITVE